MLAISKMDLAIRYLIFLFAFVAGFSRAGINISLALVTIAVVIRYIREPFAIEMDKNLRRALIIFFSVLSLSSLFSDNLAASLKVLVWSALKMLPFLYAFCFIKEEKDINKVMYILGFSIFIGSSIAIWQGMTFAVDDPVKRAKSFLGIMDFAGVLGLLIPVVLVQGFAAQRSMVVKSFCTLTLLLATAALLFNGTRSVWIAALISFILFVLLIGYKNKKVIGLIVVVGVTAGLLIVTNQAFYDRFESITNTTDVRSNTDRLKMWRYGWETFKAHPVLGVGLGALPANFDNLPEEEFKKLPSDVVSHIHNNFLMMAAENGMFGFLAFCGLYGTVYYAAWGNLRRVLVQRYAVLTVLITTDFLVHGMFDYTFMLSPVMYLYWFILGLCYRGYRLINRCTGQTT